ncbi:MAG: hypothetical protein ABFE08_10010 [Armatimonadia bacterium]
MNNDVFNQMLMATGADYIRVPDRKYENVVSEREVQYDEQPCFPDPVRNECGYFFVYSTVRDRSIRTGWLANIDAEKWNQWHLDQFWHARSEAEVMLAEKSSSGVLPELWESMNGQVERLGKIVAELGETDSDELPILLHSLKQHVNRELELSRIAIRNLKGGEEVLSVEYQPINVLSRAELTRNVLQYSAKMGVSEPILIWNSGAGGNHIANHREHYISFKWDTQSCVSCR